MYSLQKHQWIFKPFLNSYVWVPQLSSVRIDESQNHTVTAGNGSNMHKMLENWRICRTWRIFLKNIGQYVNFWMESFFMNSAIPFVLWIICKHINKMSFRTVLNKKITWILYDFVWWYFTDSANFWARLYACVPLNVDEFSHLKNISI